ncbi:hypothetical protein [Deinococcus hopiensis]|uniref:hypothetical protein n=1 Tax=Deinococcus hopiensis TaxID=309885 RepID=UPI00111C6C54|nr:hypothetical protein [Deinococcus hopiensis]
MKVSLPEWFSPVAGHAAVPTTIHAENSSAWWHAGEYVTPRGHILTEREVRLGRSCRPSPSWSASPAEALRRLTQQDLHRDHIALHAVQTGAPQVNAHLSKTAADVQVTAGDVLHKNAAAQRVQPRPLGRQSSAQRRFPMALPPGLARHIHVTVPDAHVYSRWL